MANIMIMLPMDEMLPDVRTYAPHAPEPLVFRFLRETARTLCQRLSIWRETEELDYKPDCHCVTALYDAAIVAIERADFEGVRLEPKTVPWLDQYFNNWEEAQGRPRYVTQSEPDTIFITPQAAGKLKVRLVLQSSLNAMTLPRILAMNYRSLLARGTAGYLLTSPQIDTANPDLGAALLQAFHGELDGLAIKALKTQLGAPLRTKAHFY